MPDLVMFEFELNHLEVIVYKYLSKEELIQEMRNDPAMQDHQIDTSRRKALLVRQWLQEGNMYSSMLFADCVVRGARR